MLNIYEFIAIILIAFFLILISYGIYILLTALIGITKSNKNHAFDFFKSIYTGVFTAIFIFFFLEMKEKILALDISNGGFWNFISLIIINFGFYFLYLLFIILIALIIYLIIFSREK